MKKKIIALVLSALMATSLVACGSDEGTAKSSLMVGMVTDSGTIDDKSFNQGTWEGIQAAKTEYGISEKYLQPKGEKEADYLEKIQDLVDGDYKMIVCPGFKFESAIFKAQDQYKDNKFVIIDGAPNNGKKTVVGENTVAIYFAEQEAGFVAGVATALKIKEGDLGFIGGMKIPAVMKFNYGFQQGVKYANDTYETKCTIKDENVLYEGTFTNKGAGQQLAATMYDRGVKAIFAAAGGVGTGVITEATNRRVKGEDVWMVGVDVDQYNDGIYKDKEGKEHSSVLTSAVKKIDTATKDMIKAEIDGKFPGGQTLVFDAKNDGIGLPKENPNLDEDIMAKVNEAFEKIKKGELKVIDNNDDKKFFE